VTSFTRELESKWTAVNPISRALLADDVSEGPPGTGPITTAEGRLGRARRASDGSLVPQSLEQVLRVRGDEPRDRQSPLGHDDLVTVAHLLDVATKVRPQLTDTNLHGVTVQDRDNRVYNQHSAGGAGAPALPVRRVGSPSP